MFRPEQMSKVSVTGSKAVMDDVIEAVHDLHMLHLSEYDGSWEGFENGDPIEGADDASSTLVTVRSLENILDVDPDDAGPAEHLEGDAFDARLEEVRSQANELDDRRSELQDELRTLDERIDAMEPFAELGIDLDLLKDYDSLAVAVGEGDADSVRAAVEDHDAPSEVFADDGVVAVFLAAEESELQERLVEATFTAIEVPDADGDPEAYVDSLEHERDSVESKLGTVEGEIEDLARDAGGFLLAAEERLSIQVQKTEAPLTFATTDNAFVAEGWIPTDEFDQFDAAIADAVGDRADVEELEVAAYSRHGHAETTEEVHDDESGGAAAAGAATPSAADADATEEGEVATDGGVVTMDDEPPTIQDNNSVVKPFELLTQAIGRPNYSEFDPTLILFLTFPAFFGFMIADVGYGAVYMAIGAVAWLKFDSEAIKSIGAVAFVAGLFTAIFGFFFGEIFGLHLITTHFWEPYFGSVPIHKGLIPEYDVWALAWFLVIALVGVLHLNIAYVLDFIEELQFHGAKEALLHTGSWLFALNGLWLFILSKFVSGPKPDFMFYAFDGNNPDHRAAIALGFDGLPEIVGMAGLAMVGVGFVLLLVGPTYELVEFHVILAHPLSYLRIGAELLAEVGLAFAVNLLFWGVYVTEGKHGEYWHFSLTKTPEEGAMVHGHEVTEVMFPGLVHMGPGYALLGVFVLLLGTFIVLALGVMSVGIQAIRLEYFEFLSKFYDGDGEAYRPFGRERTFTEK